MAAAVAVATSAASEIFVWHHWGAHTIREVPTARSLQSKVKGSCALLHNAPLELGMLLLI